MPRPAHGLSLGLPPGLADVELSQRSAHAGSLDVRAGSLVGYRVAIAHPKRVTALIIQNAIAHEEGLGRLAAMRKGFWADRAANEARYRAGLASIDTARLRHVNGSPHPERYNPDLWNDEVAFLARPGEADIQSDLFYDYRNNIAAFPEWQNWLREHRPPTLVVW